MAWLAAAIIGGLAVAGWCLSHGWRRSLAAGLAALSVGMLLCWHAFHPSLPAQGSYAVRATVAEEIHLRKDGQVQTVLSDVTLDGRAAPDAYWTFYLDEGEGVPAWLTPGAQLRVEARVYHPSGRENPGGFDFQEYLLQRGVSIGLYGDDALMQAEARFSLRGSIAALRHMLTLRLMDVMGEDAGAYAAAMLLGSRDFIREDDRAAFQQLGIAHLLSVSGYHVGVLVMLLCLLLRPLPLRRAAHIAAQALVLLAYCCLTGGRAPVIRAALLLLFREWTRYRHRQLLPLHMLCVTALIQLIFNPAQLFGASFQLTYGAMLGLLLVAPWLRRQRLCRHRITRYLWEAFCAALSVQVGILFPQLYWFGELPLLSVLLNIPVVALAGGLMACYWLTLVALPIPGLRTALGAASGVATRLLLGGVRGLAALGPATLWTRQADACTFLGWALLLFGCSILVPARWKRHRGRFVLGGLLLTALLLIPLSETNVTYTQFSVGDGAAAVLQDRDVTVVLDTGEDGQAVAGALHRQRQRVEVLIVTHLHTDHGGGIRALLDEGIPVDICYLPVDAATPAIDVALLSLLAELRQTGTEFRTLSRGDVIPLPSGSLTALWPEAGRVTALHDANDACLVLYADIAGVTMLLPADLPGVYEHYVAVPADVLLAAHHGSKDSTTPDFLSAVNPQVLLLSNASASREQSMADVAGERPLYTTKQHGAITLRFLGDGAFEVRPLR
ncbi:MAG: ComEC/Rec2 family competence protein [Clostridiales bacterium]|nr:ComEC/Rec2 family competence protein [Clostridiales bacterium]